MVPFILNFIVGIYSCVVAYNSLSEPGIGQAVRNKVINRQILFVFITFFFNFPSILWEILEYWASINQKTEFQEFFEKNQ